MAYEWLGRLPYPELVEPNHDAREYEIHDSRDFAGAPSLGMVNQVDRVMLVPLCEEGGSVSRHELAHVRWSPKQMPEVPFDRLILLAVEDARINLALRRAGLACDASAELRDYAMHLARTDIRSGDFAVLLLRCIASLGTDLTGPLVTLAETQAPPLRVLAAWLVPTVAMRMEASRWRTRSREIATLQAAMRIAADVAAELDRNHMRIEGRARGRLMFEGGFCLCCQTDGEDWAPLHLPVRGLGGPEDRHAAEMVIAEPALPISLPHRGRAQAHRRAMRQGAAVRFANRWFSDRAIFRGRARGRGGSVLIDTSHSMQLTSTDVDRILRAAPTATLIAIYSGHHRRGELRIVARDGRRVAPEGLEPYGQGNLIDLPALEWLSRQPPPRVWLSDGLVTGVNDWASRFLARRCRVVCLRHGIRRADTADCAAAILEGRAHRVLPVLP
jgi:hypothetical protein